MLTDIAESFDSEDESSGPKDSNSTVQESGLTESIGAVFKSLKQSVPGTTSRTDWRWFIAFIAVLLLVNVIGIAIYFFGFRTNSSEKNDYDATVSNESRISTPDPKGKR